MLTLSFSFQWFHLRHFSRYLHLRGHLFMFRFHVQVPSSATTSLGVNDVSLLRSHPSSGIRVNVTIRPSVTSQSNVSITLHQFSFVSSFRHPSFQHAHCQSTQRNNFSTVRHIRTFLRLPFSYQGGLGGNTMIFSVVRFHCLSTTNFTSSARVVTRGVSSRRRFNAILLTFRRFLTVNTVLLLNDTT